MGCGSQYSNGRNTREYRAHSEGATTGPTAPTISYRKTFPFALSVCCVLCVCVYVCQWVSSFAPFSYFAWYLQWMRTCRRARIKFYFLSQQIFHKLLHVTSGGAPSHSYTGWMLLLVISYLLINCKISSRNGIQKMENVFPSSTTHQCCSSLFFAFTFTCPRAPN